jgi:ATP-dependent DNA helicase RecG
VRTRWVAPAKRAELEPWLAERLAAGERAYWVVPRIGEEEPEDEPDDESEPGDEALAGAEVVARKLARGPLGRHGIVLVHGRMPAAERAARLARFRAGEARLCVATTVIEVGIDVPEATAIVVEGAERLGLAQLHQLRGRVGRGARDAWCLLAGTPSAEERCRLLERTDDGFALAEEDLRRRGMGDLGGLRQAGANAEGLAEDELDLGLVRLARELCASRPALRAAYAAGAAAPPP